MVETRSMVFHWGFIAFPVWGPVVITAQLAEDALSGFNVMAGGGGGVDEEEMCVGLERGRSAK